MLVEDGIDLDDLERNHGLGVGDHFHGEVGFAVGDAAADRSAHAGGVGGIDEIHIEADGDAGGVVHGVLQGFGHDVAQAALVNVAHGENTDAGFLDDFALLGVEIARADERQSREIEQPLNRAVLAECSVHHGENDVEALASAAAVQFDERGIGGVGGHHHALATLQNLGQHFLRSCADEPVALLGDADGHGFVLVRIEAANYGCC